MNRLQKEALDQGLKLNEKLLAMADNAFDWLFLRETLIKSGLTPFDTVHAGDPMSLRYYPPPAESRIEMADGSQVPVRHERHPVPLVLVPPLGVTTETFDLLPQRSLVRYMAARGYHVYLIDWGKPQKRHAGLGLKDYAIDMFGEALAEVRRHSGVQDVSLMGWCMGGLLCLMHLGFTQDQHIRNLITIASPIDLRGGGMVARAATVLNTPAKLVRKFSSLRLHMLDPIRLHAPGWLTTLAFKATDPVGSMTTYWDLLARLWDREFVESYSTTADYLNNMLLYPGGVIQDMVVKMAIDNQLAAGRIEVRDRVADLTKIKANMLVYAGTTDHLVPAQIARRIVDVVASQDKEFRIAPGGHMGVILGGGAQKNVWEPCAQWLDQRSQLVGGAKKADATAADASLRRARRTRMAEDPTL
ncbi:MAG TPA: alpha/beta fold hydrolase [Solimonas sp.]|nr:alpha/beta fold hydrolase [Solimonas sp.]